MLAAVAAVGAVARRSLRGDGDGERPLPVRGTSERRAAPLRPAEEVDHPEGQLAGDQERRRRGAARPGRRERARRREHRHHALVGLAHEALRRRVRASERRERLAVVARRPQRRVLLEDEVAVERDPEPSEDAPQAEVGEATILALGARPQGHERGAALLEVRGVAGGVLGGHLLGRAGDDQHLARAERGRGRGAPPAVTGSPLRAGSTLATAKPFLARCSRSGSLGSSPCPAAKHASG